MKLSITESQLKSLIEANHPSYLKWKRKNVTIRGIREVGEENNAGAMLGRGLYTAFLSNKNLARDYGAVHFVVNAIPKNPKVFNSLNEWEIWFYNTLVYKYSKDMGKEFPDRRDFNANTTIEDEMMKMGYDGIVIKGREMVNFKPDDNVLYFKNEQQLINYYDTVIDKQNDMVNEIDDTNKTLRAYTKDKGNDEIVSTFQDKGHYKWFDYVNPEFKIEPNDLENGLRNTLDYLTKYYGYNLKRVVIKDKGEIVAFLIYIDKNDKPHTNTDDGKTYPVLVSTAVHPDYRNRGLLKMMINKSGITKPYLVQTSAISPPGFWEKHGCKIIKRFDQFNSLEKCD